MRERNYSRAELVRVLAHVRRVSRDETRPEEQRRRAHEMVGILLARITVIDAVREDGG